MEAIKHTKQNCGTMELRKERSEGLPAKLVLVLEAYLGLIRFDLYLGRKDFDSLHVGDNIQATLNVYDSGDYDLSSVQPSSSAK